MFHNNPYALRIKICKNIVEIVNTEVYERIIEFYLSNNVHSRSNYV